MPTAGASTVKCPGCARRVQVDQGLDGVAQGRCACGRLVAVVEGTGEDGQLVRQVVVRRERMALRQHSRPVVRPHARR